MVVRRILSAAAAVAAMLLCLGISPAEALDGAASGDSSWSRESLPNGALVFTSQPQGKVVVLAEVRSSPRGRSVDFSRASERQRFQTLSSILMELGYCSRRALYDTVLNTAYCKGDWAARDGTRIPVAVYLKLEEHRFLLMMALHNADRRDIQEVVRQELARVDGGGGEAISGGKGSGAANAGSR